MHWGEGKRETRETHEVRMKGLSRTGESFDVLARPALTQRSLSLAPSLSQRERGDGIVVFLPRQVYERS